MRATNGRRGSRRTGNEEKEPLGVLGADPVDQTPAHLAALVGGGVVTSTVSHIATPAKILRHLHAVITTGQRWDPLSATHGTRRRAVLPIAADIGRRPVEQGRGEPHAALRHISSLVIGPAPVVPRTRLRCRDEPHYG
jgi:hypothetical protein